MDGGYFFVVVAEFSFLFLSVLEERKTGTSCFDRSGRRLVTRQSEPPISFFLFFLFSELCGARLPSQAQE